MSEAPIAAEVLREALKQPGRSQAALARRLGRDPSTLTRFFQGKRELRPEEIPIISAYLRETSEYRESTHLMDQDWLERNVHAASFVGVLDHAEAAPFEEVLRLGLSKIFHNLQSRFDGRLAFRSVKARDAYWYAARKDPYAILVTAERLGFLTPEDARNIELLATLGSQVSAAKTSGVPGSIVEEDSEAIGRLRALLSEVCSADLSELSQLRKALAIEMSLIAVRLLEPAEREQAVSAIRTIYGINPAAQV